MGTFILSYFKFGPEVQMEMSFKEKVSHDGRRRITIAHLESLA